VYLLLKLTRTSFTRQHLQEALKLSSTLLNTQMRSLTLLLLGNVYMQTHDDQAEKMLMTGFVHAAKTGNMVVAAAAGSSLKGNGDDGGHDDGTRVFSVWFIKKRQFTHPRPPLTCHVDLYLRTSQGIKASQQAQQNKHVLDTVDSVFQSRHLDRLVVQGQQPQSQPQISTVRTPAIVAQKEGTE